MTLDMQCNNLKEMSYGTGPYLQIQSQDFADLKFVWCPREANQYADISALIQRDNIPGQHCLSQSPIYHLSLLISDALISTSPFR